MTRPLHIVPMPSRLRFALGVIATLALAAPATANAQGLVQGVQQGAREGNKAAGPVGGVLGGAIGGVVGVVTGVTGVFTGGNNNNPNAKGGQAPATKDAKQGEASKQGEAKQGEASKPSKGSKATKTAKQQPQQQPAVLTQTGAPQLTAEQIVANSDANIERIKKELNLTPEQEKHWAGFNSAMHYLGHNGADRLNLRVARAKRDPPDDIIEQMRNEAQFLNDRAVDQRNVADAAEPLFASLDDKQKAVFIQEMVNLSHERGLD
ncbi:Spy/CpxP family protein refolding chaperone [Bradyrhizobium paxllaeri]|uniref:Spy/CpxP family protein refolding chaperone n=1 Tax=Bradyrhizobium paxllaeri TaxID=190148 RepID=UPI000810DB95|nr:Spy/CpxP family protein refolding chaperone [Bradyrhizobium paxllaeri]